MARMSTFSQANLASIEEAIAGGYLEVRYDDKVVKYQTMGDLLKARNLIANSLAATTAPAVRIDYPAVVRDYE
jgi:hypothetical protein